MSRNVKLLLCGAVVAGLGVFSASSRGDDAATQASPALPASAPTTTSKPAPASRPDRAAQLKTFFDDMGLSADERKLVDNVMKDQIDVLAAKEKTFDDEHVSVEEQFLQTYDWISDTRRKIEAVLTDAKHRTAFMNKTATFFSDGVAQGRGGLAGGGFNGGVNGGGVNGGNNGNQWQQNQGVNGGVAGGNNPGGNNPGGNNPGAGPGGQVNRIQTAIDKLGLTDDQKAQTQQVLTDMGTQLTDLGKQMADPNADRQQIGQDMRKIMEDTRTKMNALLTPEQQQQIGNAFQMRQQGGNGGNRPGRGQRPPQAPQDPNAPAPAVPPAPAPNN